MKVPPKRKGNFLKEYIAFGPIAGLNESPSEKEGKFPVIGAFCFLGGASMKVPPKRKGNRASIGRKVFPHGASMKVPPKRKGNPLAQILSPEFVLGPQ